MKRVLSFPLLFLAISSVPGHSLASVVPSSATLNWGYARDLGPHGTSLTAIPSLSTTWHAASHLAIRSSVTYLRERTVANYYTTAFSTNETQQINRSEFLPVAAGLRFYAGQDAERTRGLFLDAAPAVFVSHVPDGTDGRVFRAPLGFELGTGVRFAGMDRSRFEVGLRYFHSSAIGSPAAVTPLRGASLGERTEMSSSGWESWSLYFGIGLGD